MQELCRLVLTLFGFVLVMLKLVVEFCWLVGKVVLISAVVECYGLEPLFVSCGIFCASEMLGHFKDVEV